jgi:hypothetical protein
MQLKGLYVGLPYLVVCSEVDEKKPEDILQTLEEEGLTNVSLA